MRHTDLADFTFSTGLHYLGDEDSPTAPRTLISFMTGGAMQWARLPDAYDVYLTPHARFDVPSTPAACIEKLGTAFPDEADAIRKYCAEDIPRAAKQLIALNVANSFPEPLRALAWPIVKARSALALSTTQEVLNARFKNPDLKAILGFSGEITGAARRIPPLASMPGSSSIMPKAQCTPLAAVSGSRARPWI